MITNSVPAPMPRPILLLKSSVQFKHTGRYALYGNPPRWHLLHSHEKAPKGAPVASNPEAAGKHEAAQHFTGEQWEQLKLPADNVNAKTFNRQLDSLRQMSEAGNVTGILGQRYGTNTYGRRLATIANKLLEMHGTEHRVTHGQQAGEHAAVRPTVAPQPIDDLFPETLAEQKPTEAAHAEGDKWVMPLDAAISEHKDLVAAAETPTKADDKEELKEQKAELGRMEAAKGEQPALSMPEFQEGKTVTGVVAYYQGVAQKIMDMAADGDTAGLERMKAEGLKPNSKGKVSNTWAGKTANSKLLLDLHARAMGNTPADQPAPAVSAETVPAPAAPTAEASTAPAVDKSAKQVEKLRAVADSLAEKSDEALGRNRNTNTARRARMAGSAIDSALADQAMAKTIRNLADAIESGEAKNLGGVTSKAQVETLQALLRGGMYETDRGLSYGEQQKRKGRDPEPQDIRNARMPDFTLYGGIANTLANSLDKVRGGAKLARKLRLAAGYDADGRDRKISLTEDEAREIVAKLKTSNDKPWQLDEALKKTDRLKRMGITNDTQLQLALTEFVMFRAGKKAEDPVAKLERELVGQKVGVDFFPTPKALASRMAEMAGIKPSMKVLEPSAGSGNLADAARAAGAEVDAVEVSPQLSKLLEAKGHKLVGTNFDEFEAPGQYDAVIMNPPFSNRQDAAHIQRAYDMLKPGGKLVAIAGEGVFFGSDKKAEAFRSWLDEHGAEVEKLPAGTFEDKSLMATTGANARLMVLQKPVAAASKADDGPREGERNADGLVFRDGRWHRDDEVERAAQGTTQADSGAVKKPIMTGVEKQKSGSVLVRGDAVELEKFARRAFDFVKFKVTDDGLLFPKSHARNVEYIPQSVEHLPTGAAIYHYANGGASVAYDSTISGIARNLKDLKEILAEDLGPEKFRAVFGHDASDEGVKRHEEAQAGIAARHAENELAASKRRLEQARQTGSVGKLTDDEKAIIAEEKKAARAVQRQTEALSNAEWQRKAENGGFENPRYQAFMDTVEDPLAMGKVGSSVEFMGWAAQRVSEYVAKTKRTGQHMIGDAWRKWQDGLTEHMRAWADEHLSDRVKQQRAAVAQPKRVIITKKVDQQAHEAATSPHNDTPAPTPAQLEAGNYKKGHITVHGLDVTVENPRGSVRTGKRPDGSTWSHTMSDHYGYLKRTSGADAENIDVYVGDHHDSDKVFVIDQVNAAGEFDEHKVMLGFKSKTAAVAAYRSNFDKGWKVGPVTELSVDDFKSWLAHDDTSKPIAMRREPQYGELFKAIAQHNDGISFRRQVAIAEAKEDLVDAVYRGADVELRAMQLAKLID